MYVRIYTYCLVYVHIIAYLCVHTLHCSLILAEGYGVVNWKVIN